MTRPPPRIRARQARAAALPTDPNMMLTPDRLGSLGDGIAEWSDGKTILIPQLLPGEKAEIALVGKRGDVWLGKVERRFFDSVDRAAPACRHFGRCGGCATQHIATERGWALKQERVVSALARRGVTPQQVEPIRSVAPGDRRRAQFAVANPPKGAPWLGFNEAGGDRIVDLTECPVLAPEIVALLPDLRAFLGARLAPRSRCDVAVAWLGGRLDVTVLGGPELDLAGREAAADFIQAHPAIGRLSWEEPDGTILPLAAPNPPEVAFAEVRVTPPPGAFLQAAASGEAAIRAAVETALATPEGAEGAALDLFAGCGTLSLPLAARGRTVHAVDGLAPGLAAAQAAARRDGLRLTTETRDLERRPLESHELAKYGVVILDPPRSGARAQCEKLAALKPGEGPKLIVAVSCNPDSFARDAALLIEAGWRLRTLVPIDQFLWSTHVELVADFVRADA